MLDSALRIFLRELLDDAGLFPPASLSMEEALAEHLAILEGRERGMLGRFVAPASRLNELAGCGALLGEIAQRTGEALQVSVVFDCPDPRADYLATSEYLRGGDRSLAIRSLEVRIPRAAAADGTARVQAVLRKFGDAELPLNLAVFIEMPHDAQSIVAAAIDEIARQRASARGMLHAKLRCGGSAPGLTPDAKDVAFFLSHARKRMVPFKLTAGLHAPLRHTDPVSGAATHGLLNVVGAAVLAFAHDLDLQTLTQMLHDERAEHFHLDKHRFKWKEYTADPMMIFDARSSFVRSLGSCSFREPVEGLQRLGILPGEA
jgi:hypothetical protein